MKYKRCNINLKVKHKDIIDLNKINKSEAHIVLVGRGCPRQEREFARVSRADRRRDQAGGHDGETHGFQRHPQTSLHRRSPLPRLG